MKPLTTRRSHSRLAQATRLASVLQELGREIAAQEREIATPLGLSAVQSQALKALAEDSLTMADLAERLCIAPSTATRLVDQLESKGWVRRRPDAEDRRRSVVALTGDGEDLREELQAFSVQLAWESTRKLDDPLATLDALEESLKVLRSGD